MSTLIDRTLDSIRAMTSGSDTTQIESAWDTAFTIWHHPNKLFSRT